MTTPTLQLVTVCVLAIACQWTAWRFRLPSILLLLACGIIAGPFSELVQAEVISPVIMPFLSLAVALVLFEGALTLDLRELAHTRVKILPIIIRASLLSWGLNILGAYLFLKVSWGFAMIIGGILVATGPTVIMPMLRHIHANRKIGTVIKWEGIINDPIGIMLSVLTFEALFLAGDLATTPLVALPLGVLRTLAIAGIIAFISGRGFLWLLNRFLIPDHLLNPLALTLSLAAFTISNVLQPESGLFTVVLLGIYLANKQPETSTKKLSEFKESLQVLLVGVLFIFLSSQLTRDDLSQVNSGSVYFLVYLIFIARPAAIFLGGIGVNLNWREKLLLAFLAPRGIVVVVLASLFSLELAHSHPGEASLLRPTVFFIVGGTVVFYGICARFIAVSLGLATANPQGVLILGGHSWARQIAHALLQEGIDLLLIDTNRSNIQLARRNNIPSLYGNIFSERILEELDITSMGKVLALTENEEINMLGSIQLRNIFGHAQIYQLPPANYRRENEANLKVYGRLLFNEQASFQDLQQQFAANQQIQRLVIDSPESYEEFLKEQQEAIIPLFLLSETKTLDPFTVDHQPNARKNSLLLYIRTHAAMTDSTKSDSM